MTVDEQRAFANKFIQHIEDMPEGSYIREFNNRVNNKQKLDDWVKKQGKLPKVSKDYSVKELKVKTIANKSAAGRLAKYLKKVPIIKYGLAYVTYKQAQNTFIDLGYSSDKANHMAMIEALNPLPAGGPEDVARFNDRLKKEYEEDRQKVKKTISRGVNVEEHPELKELLEGVVR